MRDARAQGVRVIDRCNLTILSEPGQDGLAEFLAEQGVEMTASLPCYSPANVDRQRGDGVFERSIAALRQLNALGYGQPGSGRVLNLVYNPQGAVLPPPQGPLEEDYRRELAALRPALQPPVRADQHADPALRQHAGQQGQLRRLHAALRGAYRAANLDTVMCRSPSASIGKATCTTATFNQMLGLHARLGGTARPHLRDLLQHDPAGPRSASLTIAYGCTAGQGSSCGGALDATAPVSQAA